MAKRLSVIDVDHCGVRSAGGMRQGTGGIRPNRNAHPAPHFGDTLPPGASERGFPAPGDCPLRGEALACSIYCKNNQCLSISKGIEKNA